MEGWYDQNAHKPEERETVLIPASSTLFLVPGQYLLYMNGSGTAYSELIMFPSERPFIELKNERFIRGISRLWIRGLPLGDGRYFEQAANRALKETQGMDWIGGMADFATCFLRPSRAVRNAERKARATGAQHS